MSKITLYQLANDLSEVLDQVDPDTGELPDEYGAVRELVANKAASVAAYITACELDADAIDSRLKEVALQVKRERAKAQRLREYLLECMQKTGITEIESNDRLLKIKRYPDRDEYVEIDAAAAEQIPEQFVRIKKEPDKAEIKKALKAGKEFSFARLVKKDRLSIG